MNSEVIVIVLTSLIRTANNTDLKSKKGNLLFKITTPTIKSSIN